MKRKNYLTAQIFIGILCALLAFTAAAQYKNMGNPEAETEADSGQSNTQLREENVSLKEKNTALEMQLAAARNDIEQYREAAADSGNYEQVLTRQLKRAETLAGLTEVRGEGVKIILTDSESVSGAEDAVEEFIIHDSDLRLVITELAAAGAEAFSINGQRIISATPIRCVGPVITINEVKTAPPFEILAVGDKKMLEAAVNMRGGIADLFSGYGIGVSVEVSDEITVPRYAGSFDVLYSEEGGDAQ